MTEPATPPPGAPPPDLPPVPRAKRSLLATVLGAFGALVVTAYSVVAYTDYEPGSPAHEAIPASVRSSPGGYRSFHFWHSGYHGGK
jgi:hypothetical protein